MLLPSVFGESLLDDWMDFPKMYEFPDIDKKLYGKHAGQLMKTDVKEHDKGYELDIDLPGFKKDEIKLSLDHGYLSVSASKGLREEDKDKHGHMIRRERYTGSMQRSFYIGDAVTEEDIKAKFEDGVLRLSVPKKDAKAVESVKTIAIE